MSSRRWRTTALCPPCQRPVARYTLHECLERADTGHPFDRAEACTGQDLRAAPPQIRFELKVADAAFRTNGYFGLRLQITIVAQVPCKSVQYPISV